MTPVFTCAIRYRVETECVTPLHTGAERDVQQILRRADGTPFLQGASLAGALRAWRDSNALFGGSDSGEGELSVSDLLFSKGGNSRICLRPRLAVNGKTGTAGLGGKFDVAQLAAGAVGEFSLVWRGKKEHKDERAAEIERYLSALSDGEIRLGAQKTNGFGQVRLTVYRQDYELFSERDRSAWLNDTVAETALALAPVQNGDRIHFVVHGFADAILIKASAGGKAGAEQLDAVHICENGKLILPGSSIKGAVRAHIMRIAPCCGLNQEDVEHVFGRIGKEDNGVAGKVVFSEAHLTKPKNAPIVHRIRINRFTGGILRKGLFNERPENGDCELHISLPAREEKGAMLIFYALRDLGLGLYTLGSGSSVGYGRIELVNVEIQTPHGSAELTFSAGRPELADPNGIVPSWRGRLEGAAK